MFFYVQEYKISITIDSLGHSIKSSGKRIVSLVPSWTEFLYSLRITDRLIGRTIFCPDPSNGVEIPTFGGTKNPNLQEITSVSPDLVIANKEENKQEDINFLKSYNIPVFITSAIREEMITISKLVGSNKLPDFEKYLNYPKGNSFTFTYLVWDHPLMLAGNNTYISHLISHCGGINVSSKLNENERYPKISVDKLLSFSPDVMIKI